jgi:hypothetical protein
MAWGRGGVGRAGRGGREGGTGLDEGGLVAQGTDRGQTRRAQLHQCTPVGLPRCRAPTPHLPHAERAAHHSLRRRVPRRRAAPALRARARRRRRGHSSRARRGAHRVGQVRGLGLPTGERLAHGALDRLQLSRAGARAQQLQPRSGKVARDGAEPCAHRRGRRVAGQRRERAQQLARGGLPRACFGARRALAQAKGAAEEELTRVALRLLHGALQQRRARRAAGRRRRGVSRGRRWRQEQQAHLGNRRLHRLGELRQERRRARRAAAGRAREPRAQPLPARVQQPLQRVGCGQALERRERGERVGGRAGLQRARALESGARRVADLLPELQNLRPLVREQWEAREEVAREAAVQLRVRQLRAQQPLRCVGVLTRVEAAPHDLGRV